MQVLSVSLCPSSFLSVAVLTIATNWSELANSGMREEPGGAGCSIECSFLNGRFLLTRQFFSNWNMEKEDGHQLFDLP
ncbi:unnamed protein product [Calypogeia fissa]